MNFGSVKKRLKFILSFGNLPPNVSRPFIATYEVRIPRIKVELTAKTKEEALREAKKTVKETMDVFLMSPENWREKR